METMPPEVLCEIFRLLCDKPISLHVPDNDSSCSDKFPWAIGQVCKRWREEFLSYLHLWTSLSLRYRPTDIVGVDLQHEMNRRTLICLERSKQLPLTITVCIPYGSSIEKIPRTTWKLLLSCSERWERADLALSHEPLLLDILRCKMPIVKSLRLRLVSFYSSHLRLYHPVPCLTELNLFAWFGELVLPWSQLKKVEISPTAELHFIGGKKLETILSQLQNVEELRIGSFDVLPMNDDRDQCPIQLASLRLLAVPICPFQILPRIEAPLLEHLWVDMGPMYTSTGFTKELSFFIRRSSCHIRQLTLHYCEYHLLPDLMKLLSSIEELCIRTTVDELGSFFVKHVTEMNDGVCLPNLRELEVTCCRGRDDDEKLMAAMSRILEMRSAESRLISVRREEMPLEPTRVRIFMSFK